MKRFFTLVALVVSTHLAAQIPDTIDCDVPDYDSVLLEDIPWFGNNIYLENFLDSIGYPSESARIVGQDRVRYHVPVKFWIYRASNGSGGPSIIDLQRYIDDLNRFYNVDHNTLIGFYMKCNIGYINDDDHLNVGDLEAATLIQNHKEAGAINIHVTNSVSGSFGVLYRARFFGVDGIFLNQETYTNPALSGTIAHEVGHYFELFHTHQYSDKGSCRQEAVDRNRTWPFFNFCPSRRISNVICEATGDLLADTPADPDLSTNNSCTYILTGKFDTWGDSYSTPPSGSLAPSPSNLMSYNRARQCRTDFSRQQIESIVEWKGMGMQAKYGKLKTYKRETAAKKRHPEILDAFEVAENISKQDNISNILKVNTTSSTRE